MRQSRFSQTEIVYAVKQVEMGVPIKEIARKYGVCENTVWSREALENFAEVLAILREWDEAERREPRYDDDNADAASA